MGLYGPAILVVNLILLVSGIKRSNHKLPDIKRFFTKAFQGYFNHLEIILNNWIEINWKIIVVINEKRGMNQRILLACETEKRQRVGR